MCRRTLIPTLAILIGLGMPLTSYSFSPKLKRTENLEGISPAHRGKPTHPLRVVIAQPDVLPVDDTVETSLTAYIRSRDLSNSAASFEWILPEGVTASTPTQGSVSLVGKQEVEIVLKVRGFTDNIQKQIALRVQAGAHSATDIVVSRPQDTLEQVAPLIRVQEEEFQKKLEEQGSSTSTTSE